jgi:hypothetical protein
MLYLQNVYKSFFIGFQNRIEYLLYNCIECSLSDDLNKDTELRSRGLNYGQKKLFFNLLKIADLPEFRFGRAVS